MKVILGSQSRGRQQILRDAGYDFTVQAADIDEKAIRSDDYEQLPLLVAHAKADALKEKLQGEETLLITADSVVTFKGELREKPISEAQAREFLRSYEPGTPAWVNTGVVVTDLSTGKQVEGFDKAAVYFKRIPESIIDQAIQDGYVFGCAGAFAIETPLLAPYVDHTHGPTTAIIGLPLELTQNLLHQAAARS